MMKVNSEQSVGSAGKRPDGNNNSGNPVLETHFQPPGPSQTSVASSSQQQHQQHPTSSLSSATPLLGMSINPPNPPQLNSSSSMPSSSSSLNQHQFQQQLQQPSRPPSQPQSGPMISQQQHSLRHIPNHNLGHIHHPPPSHHHHHLASYNGLVSNQMADSMSSSPTPLHQQQQLNSNPNQIPSQYLPFQMPTLAHTAPQSHHQHQHHHHQQQQQHQQQVNQAHHPPSHLKQPTSQNVPGLQQHPSISHQALSNSGGAPVRPFQQQMAQHLLNAHPQSRSQQQQHQQQQRLVQQQQHHHHQQQQHFQQQQQQRFHEEMLMTIDPLDCLTNRGLAMRRYTSNHLSMNMILGTPWGVKDLIEGKNDPKRLNQKRKAIGMIEEEQRQRQEGEAEVNRTKDGGDLDNCNIPLDQMELRKVKLKKKLKRLEDEVRSLEEKFV